MKAAELQALYSAAKITYSIYRFLDDNMAQFLQEQIDVDLQSAGEFMTLFLRKKRGFQLFSAKIRHFNSKKLGKTVVL